MTRKPNSLYKYFALISSGISGLAIALVFLLANPFSIKVISTKANGKDTVVYYNDLDRDGKSEEVTITNYDDHHVGILIYKDNSVLDEWALPGRHHPILENAFHDLDNDGVREIMIFHYSSDSLFLSCLDPINASYKFKNSFVDNIAIAEGRSASSPTIAGFFDTDGDGQKEVFISVMTGFHLKPRKIYRLNYISGQIINSKESNVSFGQCRMFDANNDSIPEIIINSGAVGNGHIDDPYSDFFSWLMVFNSDLEFLFPPVCLGDFPSSSYIVPIHGDGVLQLLVLHYIKGKEPSYLARFNGVGELLDKKEFNLENPDLPIRIMYHAQSNQVKLVASDGNMYRILPNLALKHERNLGDLQQSTILSEVNIFGDQDPEYIVMQRSRHGIFVYPSNLRSYTELHFQPEIKYLIYSRLYGETDGANLAIDTGNIIYKLKYDRSLIFKYWYLAIVLILAASMIFVYLAYLFYDIRRLRINQNRNSLAELQLKAVQNQIDPHFTFNLLTAFKNLIDEEDKERAEFVFENYSRLLKRSVLNGEKLAVSLEEELDFVKSYAELEEFRNSGKFTLKIKTGENLDKSLEVPKMMVHIFVENAIKHGLRNKSGNEGLLTISAEKENGHVRIMVRDNGIGRQSARQLQTFSTGRGLELVNKMIPLYRNLFHRTIRVEIIDLQEYESPSGTEVNIYII